MKKGFTLIELLAVIVILALIALVTIPMINNVIEKAKKGALEDSAYGLKSAAELYYSTTEIEEAIEFECNEEGCINEDKKLPFKGSIKNGKVKLHTDGNIWICIDNEKYSSILKVNEKIAETKLGSCKFENDDYTVTELVSASEYKKVKNDFDSLKNTLYNKTLISSVNNDIDIINSEINALDLTATSYEIYENGKRVYGYPDGLYNVGIECEGATGIWSNAYNGVVLANVNSKDVKCKINFVTCTTGDCDTNTIAWENWLTLLGYNPSDYVDLNDFLSQKVKITSCSDLEILYGNKSGAYDYLRTQTSLINQINENVDFSACNIGFEYTGTVQEYPIVYNGIYKLEVYGAQGGNISGYTGGKGGYSIGYAALNNDSSAYVCVGGQNSYNGGGGIGRGAYDDGSQWPDGAQGGGATHIATLDGNLSSLVNNKNKVLIVAGGGSGASSRSNGSIGGGSAGNSGTSGSGGTQTSSYAFGQGGKGIDGVSSDDNARGGSGGGGGWYGGYGATSREAKTGGGGSGYIGGVTSYTKGSTISYPSTSGGVRSGNGYAKITFVGIN